MAFYDFTGANGDPLPVGLTAQNGTFEIQSNTLVGTGAVPVDPLWIATTPSKADGTFIAIANANGAVSGASGVVCRYSSNGNFIMAVINAINSSVVLFRRQAGAFVNIGSYVIPSFDNTSNYKVAIVATGSALKVQLDDVDVITGVTETHNQTETLAGLRIPDAVHSIDELNVTDAVVTDSITITTSDFRIWADVAGQREITIDGNYTGAPTSIERSVDGGGFVSAIASPVGGIFSDVFTLPIGQYSIEYRFSNDTGVTDTVTFISIGSVMAGYGQSNMNGRGTNNQTYSPSAGGVRASLFGNDYNFKELVDPWNSAVGQVDLVAESANAMGSWALRFASEWFTTRETPIGFNVTAVGGKTVDQLSKTSADRIDGLNMYEALIKQVTAIGGITELFYEQGEADAKDSNGNTAAQYQADLNQLVNDIKSDLGVNTFIVPLHTITAAGYYGNGTTTGQIPVRDAQIAVAASNANCRIGQPLTDIDISVGAGDGDNDGLHFKTDLVIDEVGVRTYTDWSAASVSTLNFTVTGLSNTTRTVKYIDWVNDVILKTEITSFDGSGNATTSLNVAASTVIVAGYLGDNPPTTGTGIYGETV